MQLGTIVPCTRSCRRALASSSTAWQSTGSCKLIPSLTDKRRPLLPQYRSRKRSGPSRRRRSFVKNELRVKEFARLPLGV